MNGRSSDAKHRTHVGILGTGVMGSTIGMRMVETGWSVTAYNRTRSKTDALAAAGARIVDTPYEAMQDSDVVLALLTNSHTLDGLLFGPDGALTRSTVRHFVVDLATNDPVAVARTGERVQSAGSDFLEAPVTGSVHDTSHGTLSFLCGGAHDTYEHAQPLLEQIGNRAFFMGSTGAGASAKLALNLLVGVMAEALGEAIAMIEAERIDIGSFHQAHGVSGLASPPYQRLGRRYVDNDFEARFSLANLEKDMERIRDRSAALGLQPVLTNAMVRHMRAIHPAAKNRDYSFLVAQRKA